MAMLDFANMPLLDLKVRAKENFKKAILTF
jgi:hypothetical protein